MARSIELKDVDKEAVLHYMTTSHLYKLIQEFNSWNFEVGDVLVRYSYSTVGGRTKNIELVSSSCRVPKKYKIVYIDDAGIPWTKQVSVRGGYGKKIRPLTNISDGWSNTVAIDPEQIDAILLGYKYDPRSEYKKMRNGDPEYGKKEP